MVKFILEIKNILPKYVNFAIVYLKKLAKILLQQILINLYAISLKYNK